MKRSYESHNGPPPPYKKRLVACEQHKPQHVEPAPQLPSFAGGQLLRSIVAALRLAGFDSVTPSALEMFRGQVEEYMLRFAKDVRTSMTGQRRTRPVAPDFSFALAHTSNARAARVLRGQLALKLPEAISCPEIPEPPPAPSDVPNFSALLQPLLPQTPPTWIPKHFPQLPSQHSWKSTDVWPVRETDARKMREQATEEGLLAEQALRRLAQAAKSSALQEESKRRNVLAGLGKPRERRPNNDDLLGTVLQEIGVEDGAPSAGDGRQPLDLAQGILVNSDAAHWRGGKRQGIAF